MSNFKTQMSILRQAQEIISPCACRRVLKFYIMPPKVAIIYLSFHCEPYMPEVVRALEKLIYPKDRIAFVIVDNPHPEHGPSIPYLQKNVSPKSENELPKTVLIANEKNVGFSHGNNVGARWALENGYDYIYFHNNDAYMDPDCLGSMVEAMEKDKNIGIAQSLVRLHPERSKINTTGNALHILGYGYCRDYKCDVDSVVLPAVSDIPYASGSSLMVSADFLRIHGGWSSDFFMYHEDTEISLRARVARKRVVLVRDSYMYHQYEFRRSISKYYWMERNRFAILLMYYKWPTLLLLSPGLLIMEVGTFGLSLRTGWWREKLKVYIYWTKLANWRLWLSKRKKIQAKRAVSDRYLLSFTTGQILFQEEEVESPLLKYIANPFFAVYAWVVKKVVIW